MLLEAITYIQEGVCGNNYDGGGGGGGGWWKR